MGAGPQRKGGAGSRRPLSEPGASATGCGRPRSLTLPAPSTRHEMVSPFRRGRVTLELDNEWYRRWAAQRKGLTCRLLCERPSPATHDHEDRLDLPDPPR